MHKILVLLICLLTACGAHQIVPQKSQPKIETTHSASSKLSLYTDINWYKFDSVAFTRAKIKHCVIVLYFHEDGCPFCSQMENTTFNDPVIITKLNDKFVPVKLIGSEHPDIVQTLLGEPAFPGTAFLTPDGSLIYAYTGYIQPANYNKALDLLIEASAK